MSATSSPNRASACGWGGNGAAGASLITGDDGSARRHELDRRNGLAGRVDGAIFRTLASEAATVRIELD